MIPKNIHYVWLSGEEMPELNRKCVEKWEYVLPDYTIRKWTAKDFDLEAIPFIQEAIQEKKWAFATDCLRAEILFREGGIYLDSDIWLYDSFDSFLDNRFFSFIEYHHDSTFATIQAACMGSEAGHPFPCVCAEFYRKHHFIFPDGSFNMEKLAPDIYAELAIHFGFDLENTGEQVLESGIHIYMTDL